MRESESTTESAGLLLRHDLNKFVSAGLPMPKSQRRRVPSPNEEGDPPPGG